MDVYLSDLQSILNSDLYFSDLQSTATLDYFNDSGTQEICPLSRDFLILWRAVGSVINKVLKPMLSH